MSIENTGLQSVDLDRLTLLGCDPIPRKKPRISGIHPQDAAFFSNGWQSWSYAGAYAPGDRFRRTRLGMIRRPTDVNAGTPIMGLDAGPMMMGTDAGPMMMGTDAGPPPMRDAGDLDAG